ncbi:putative two-component response regulatory protein [Bradyrhizobium sp. ORS 278]|uniref:response regulator n=1 Tax=Bradyrhizobium sp. (strain ORS 278) TaxID=114615 RepID=UPI0001508B3E|nr:response regulator [Bradyrhizobium sp. ORS 278]CAL76656.1 putative two-component response regulatory protein [Bradyrhizobium sp. ORS 278]
MPRVLVVDDQKDVRAMISMVLRVNQFEVVEAGTAPDGLKLFRAQTFDVVIVDIYLEESNGLDLVSEMRRLVPDVPVVAVSGMSAFDGAAMSDELTRVVYLQKPFRPGELMNAVEMARTAVEGRAAAALSACAG